MNLRNYLAIALLLLPALAWGSDTPPVGWIKSAENAYDTRQYAESVRLYELAFAQGEQPPADYYNAACSASLGGDLERGFALLGQALMHGFNREQSLRTDADLSLLRADARWPALMAALRTANPWLAFDATLNDVTLPASQRYLRVRHALDEGMQAPSDRQSPFLQLYATVAAMVGDYDTADRLYLSRKSVDPVASGYLRARPANATVLALAKGRRAVFINESHGRAQSRAAIYTLLEPLYAQGFRYLGMETLTPAEHPPSTAACPGAILADADLPGRGYPIIDTGYYTREPVDAEIVREAIRLGYRLVSYEASGKQSQRQDSREEAQASHLACLFKSDPKARVLVIAGFGHISENDHHPASAGGMMAHRFTRLTGIDPLTVDTTNLLGPPPAQIVFPRGKVANPSEGFVLTNAAGAPFRVNDNGERYDISLLVRSPAHRNEATPSWLSLGGARRRLKIDPAPCQGKRPCLIEARRESEPNAAIIGDGCVLSDGETAGCNLFLTPGRQRISYFDADMHRLQETTVNAGF